MTSANQEGGVGKTTLCVTFANHLMTKGVRVAIIDCNFQHSIVKRRKTDIYKYGEEHTPYDALSYEANDKKAIIDLVEKLYDDPGIDVVLMDSPGSLRASGLVPISVNSDIIIIPFHYDLVTVPSAVSFLMLIDRLRRAVGGRVKARLFIVPSLHNGRVGRRSELVIWDNARKTFPGYGYVTARVPRRADMERFSTMAALNMQDGVVAPVFERIYTDIFDTAIPIREVVLPNIQQMKKSDKKKSGARPTTENENK